MSAWPRRLRRLGEPHALLLLVCLGHLAVTLAFVLSGHVWWQQDETAYISQVAAHQPALNLTAPRARGLPALLFPLVHFTTGVAAIRTYLAVLSTIGLYLGLRPWLRLGFGRVVAGAALLFATLWATGFWSALVEPNIFVAVASLGAVASAVLALRAERPRNQLLVAGVWATVLGLMRPADATWLLIAVGLVVLLAREHRVRRRLAVCGVLLAGLALGWVEWGAEAIVYYNGFFPRLRSARAENTPGIHFSLLAEARDVNGPVLCRPCSGVPVHVSHLFWWFLIPPLAGLGLAAARRTTRSLPLVLATVGGLAVLAEYCLTIDYAAPRFLLPTYALLALPCAAGLAALLRWPSAGTARTALAGAVVVGMVLQTGYQTVVLRHNVTRAASARTRFLRAATTLRRDGVHPPCIIYGRDGPPVAFALRCDDEPRGKAARRLTHSGTYVVATTVGTQHSGKHPHLPTVLLGAGAVWIAHLRPPGPRHHHPGHTKTPNGHVRGLARRPARSASRHRFARSDKGWDRGPWSGPADALRRPSHKRSARRKDSRMRR